MKKLLLTAVAICMLPLAAFAQEATETKKAEEKAPKVYLPEKGDWSIGFNVAPMLSYIGNLFNGNTNNSLDALNGQPITDNMEGYKKNSIAPDISIMGKYMLTDEWAVRANIGFMVRSNRTNSYVQDDKAVELDPFSEALVVDQMKEQNHGVSLLLGGEYRKGKKRVQGVFGAGLLFGLQKTKTSYKYGNELTELNQQPTLALGGYTSSGYRIDTQKTDSDIFAGLTCSAGVEWFVAPKISLGAEVNLSLYYVFGGQEWTTSTGYNTALGTIEQRTDLTSPGSDSFRFGTHNLGGSLYMSFYF